MENENLQSVTDEKSQKVKSFLHDIDLDRLKEETGMSVEQLAGLAEFRNPRCIYPWAKPGENGGTRPSYNAIVRLLEAGASVNTLFGVDERPVAGRARKDPAMTGDDLRGLVLKALEELGYGKPPSV